MTDNKKNRGEPDRSLINLNESYEVRYWSTKFGCSSEELKRAVKHVGNTARDVERALLGKGKKAAAKK